MKGRPVDQLVYEYMFPKPGSRDPKHFHDLLQRYLVIEVRSEVLAFYGHLDTHEAKYPGLDYCHHIHRIRLARWPWHRRLFRAFDGLRLTPAEIASLTKWEGTRWAKERYEKEQGFTIHDSAADGMAHWPYGHDRPIGPHTLDTTTTTPTHLDSSSSNIADAPIDGLVEDDEDEDQDEEEDETETSSDNQRHDIRQQLLDDQSSQPLQSQPPQNHSWRRTPSQPANDDESDHEQQLQSFGLALSQRLQAQVARRDAGDTTAVMDEEWEQWLKNALDAGELPFMASQQQHRQQQQQQQQQQPSPPSSSPHSLQPPQPLQTQASRSSHNSRSNNNIPMTSPPSHPSTTTPAAAPGAPLLPPYPHPSTIRSGHWGEIPSTLNEMLEHFVDRHEAPAPPPQNSLRRTRAVSGFAAIAAAASSAASAPAPSSRPSAVSDPIRRWQESRAWGNRHGPVTSNPPVSTTSAASVPDGLNLDYSQTSATQHLGSHSHALMETAPTTNNATNTTSSTSINTLHRAYNIIQSHIHGNPHGHSHTLSHTAHHQMYPHSHGHLSHHHHHHHPAGSQPHMAPAPGA